MREYLMDKLDKNVDKLKTIKFAHGLIEWYTEKIARGQEAILASPSSWRPYPIHNLIKNSAEAEWKAIQAKARQCLEESTTKPTDTGWGIADEDKELWKVSPGYKGPNSIRSTPKIPSLPNWTMERRRRDVEEHGPDSPWHKCFLTEAEYVAQGRPSGWYRNVGVLGSLTIWYENARPEGLNIMKDEPANMKYLSVEAWKDMADEKTVEFKPGDLMAYDCMGIDPPEDVKKAAWKYYAIDNPPISEASIDECPCGGPAGHVPNGMNCRKIL